MSGPPDDRITSGLSGPWRTKAGGARPFCCLYMYLFSIYLQLLSCQISVPEPSLPAYATEMPPSSESLKRNKNEPSSRCISRFSASRLLIKPMIRLRIGIGFNKFFLKRGGDRNNANHTCRTKDHADVS